MRSRTRTLLTAALGGLILLTGVVGVTALVVFERIRGGEAALHGRLAEQSRWLEQIRAGIYQSGTLARDYFVAAAEPEGGALLDQLRTLEAANRKLIDRHPEAAELRGEVDAYWRLLGLMEDMAGARHRPGLDAYFRRQLAQRRDTMRQIADSTGAALDREWLRGDREFAALYHRLRAALIVEIALVIALGIVVALWAVRKLVRLEGSAHALSSQLVRAQEEERRAIARELHDEIGQTLSAIRLEAASAGHPENATNVPSHLISISTLAETAVDALRRIALSLRPSMLDDLGLVPALEWQAREVGNRTGLNIEVTADDNAGELPEAHRTCIYRVVQETLQNCVRHSQASRVKIDLAKAARLVAVRVEDNGKGFRPGRTKGLGLLGMEERVAQLGGRFRVHSEQGRGTTVTVELPV